MSAAQTRHAGAVAGRILLLGRTNRLKHRGSVKPGRLLHSAIRRGLINFIPGAWIGMQKYQLIC
jgi:hypothetical protein